MIYRPNATRPYFAVINTTSLICWPRENAMRPSRDAAPKNKCPSVSSGLTGYILASRRARYLKGR
jgi:hypothetical protein